MILLQVWKEKQDRNTVQLSKKISWATYLKWSILALFVFLFKETASPVKSNVQIYGAKNWKYGWLINFPDRVIQEDKM